MLKSKIKFCACALLVAVIFCSCHGDEIADPVIKSKYYTNFFGSPMPKGICRFTYIIDEGDGCIQEFQDSCHLYSLGDRVWSKK
jgi:hypothetical protein